MCWVVALVAVAAAVGGGGTRELSCVAARIRAVLRDRHLGLSHPWPGVFHL